MSRDTKQARAFFEDVRELMSPDKEDGKGSLAVETGSGRCPKIKWGEYNKLICAREAGHPDECCWVAVHEPHRREKYDRTRRALSAPNVADEPRGNQPSHSP